MGELLDATQSRTSQIRHEEVRNQRLALVAAQRNWTAAETPRLPAIIAANQSFTDPATAAAYLDYVSS
jgi:hypothetical protein